MNPVKKHIHHAQHVGEKTRPYIVRGFLQGIGWAFGATIGFAIVIGMVGFILSKLGALPVIGQFFSDIREATDALQSLRETLPR